MATSHKKPTSKVESDHKRASAAEPEKAATKPRAPQRKPAAQAAPITPAKAKRTSSGETTAPARPRRKAAPVREPDSMDLADTAAGQIASPVPATQPTHPTREQIAERAYHIFLSRGGQHGRHDEDWQQAERELCSNE